MTIKEEPFITISANPLRYVSLRHPYVIVGRDNCPFCEKAKKLLEKKDFGYAYVNLTYWPEEAERLKREGFKSIPQIWYKGSLVTGVDAPGGYAALVEVLGE
jgi:glutaredoxin